MAFRTQIRTFCLGLAIALFSAASASAAPTPITVSSGNDAGAGTLREAINQANADPNPDGSAITFSGDLTINTASPLPTILHKTSIDGSAHHITIEAINQGTGDGLTIDGPGSVILGLTIVDAPGNGITLGPGSDGTLIGGVGSTSFANFIGTNSSGAIKPNGGWGVAVTSGTGSVVGVASSAQFSNVIEYNRAGGVLIQAPASGNSVLNSIFENNKGPAGVLIDGASNNVVGGLPAGSVGSLFAFNSGDGVKVTGAGANSNVTKGNTITLNTGAGVNLAGAGDANTITQNSISSNTGLGITLLGTTTPKPNVATNPGPSPNRSQNYPVITSTDTGNKTINGTLHSSPNASFTVEFFNTGGACDSSGFGQGNGYIGSTTVTTDASGDGSFSFISTSAFTTVTATATDAQGDTSEFSQCFPQFAGPHIQLSTVQVSFGDHDVGTQSPVTYVNAKNTGTTATTLASSALSGSSSFSRDPGNGGSAPSCSDGMSLNPGDSCDFGLDFAPTQAGAASGRLDATFTGTKPLTVLLSGNGLTPQPANSTPPTVNGTAKVGQTLSMTDGTWSGPSLSFSRQWQRCDASGSGCADIGGATGNTYGLVKADAEHTIRVVVTATNERGSTPAPSAPTSVVPKVPNTKITKSEIDKDQGSATFKFKAIGTATGFQCKLRRNNSDKKPKFKACDSPQSYDNLEKGHYTFSVRAVNDTTKDPSPVRKRFTIDG